MWKVCKSEEGVHWAAKPDVQRMPGVKGQVQQIQRTQREGWHRRGEGQGTRYMVTGLRSTHANESLVRPAPKIHKKGSICEMIKVSDNDKPGPSRAHSKCIITMPIHTGLTGKPITWAQVAVLDSMMHNMVGQMQVMEVDIHSILGWMCRMESEVAGMLEKLAEMKEGLANV